VPQGATVQNTDKQDVSLANGWHRAGAFGTQSPHDIERRVLPRVHSVFTIRT